MSRSYADILHSARLGYRRLTSQLELPPGWRRRCEGDGRLEWCHFQPEDEPLPAQGWKLHLSVAAVDAPRLADAMQVLFDHRSAFKIPSTIDGVIAINAGEAGPLIIGKVLTAYPRPTGLAGVVRDLISLNLPAGGPALLDEFVPAEGLKGPIALRFGGFERVPAIDRYGRYSEGMISPSGERIVDDRSASEPPAWAPNPPLPMVRSVEESPATDLETHGFMLLAQLNDSYKSQVWLVADPAAEIAVAKVVRRGLFGDVTGRDAQSRLDNERRMLEHLDGSAIGPGLAGEGLSIPGVLLLEDLGGVTLDNLGRAEALSELPGLARTIAALHRRGIVHRDIKPSNVLVTPQGVRLLDFELSAFIGDERPLIGSTFGFASGAAELPVAPSADVFALGICLAHLLIGCSPSALPPEADTLSDLVEAIAGREPARLVRGLTDPEPQCRPTAAQAAGAIEQLLSRGPRPPPAAPSGKPAIRTGDIAALEEILNPYFRQGSWRNSHVHRPFPCEEINIGSAGIAHGLLMLRAAYRAGTLDGLIKPTIAKLARSRGTGIAFGFLSGDAGAVLPLRAGAACYGEADLADAAHRRLERCVEGVDENDLFAGRAGLLLLCSLLQKWEPGPVTARLGERLAGELAAGSGLESGLIVWPARLPIDEDPDPLLGAAHGACGIAAALAHWGNVSGDADALALARQTFSRLLRFGTSDAGLRRRANSDLPPTSANEWCHGAAGFAWALALSGLSYSEVRDELHWSAEKMKTAPAFNNATICHGMAGMVEVWRLLGRIPEFTVEAGEALAELRRLLLVAGRRNGRLLWRSDLPDTVTPDLWVGFLGPWCQLALLDRNDRRTILDPALAV